MSELLREASRLKMAAFETMVETMGPLLDGLDSIDKAEVFIALLVVQEDKEMRRLVASFLEGMP